MNLYKILILILVLQIIFVENIRLINPEQKNDENRKENKISSSSYDITKGVILGIAISFATSYLNKEKISSLLDGLNKMIKSKPKEGKRNGDNDDIDKYLSGVINLIY